jgi:hypothetical protein
VCYAFAHRSFTGNTTQSNITYGKETQSNITYGKETTVISETIQ